MSELVVYEIGYDPAGLDALKIQAAQSCVRLANDGGAGGPISPFYSVEEARRALNSVATKDDQAVLQLRIEEVSEWANSQS